MPAPVLLLLVDGVGDVAVPGLGFRSCLDAAAVPTLDAVAAAGLLGLMDPVRPGLACGSDTAHLSLLGYPPERYYRGRGAFEAMGAGLEMAVGDIAFKSNFATLDVADGRTVLRRRVDRNFPEWGRPLCAYLDGMAVPGFPDVQVAVKYATEHRCGVRLRGPGLTDQITGTDPLTDGKPLLRCEARSPEAERTAAVVNAVHAEMHRLLSLHPLNEERVAAGQPPANIVLLRGAGELIDVPSFRERHDMRAFMIAPTCIIAGLGQSLGIEIVTVPGATGDYHSDLAAKTRTAARLLATGEYDFGFVHFKAVDDAGHDRDVEKKIHFLQEIDAALSLVLPDLAPDCVVAVTGDHSTPVESGDHSYEPVPFAVARAGALLHPPAGQPSLTFGEVSAAAGALGRFSGAEMMPLLKRLAGCSYAVVASAETRAAWPSVVPLLLRKHADKGAFAVDLAGAEAELRRLRPRYVCFVAHWSECSKAFVREAHALTRGIDSSHPFSDAFWAILTGATEQHALECAADDQPLTIRRVASGTAEGVALGRFESGVAFDELVRGRVVRSSPAEGQREEVVDGCTALLIPDELVGADMIITSGHATETEWNVGFRFRGGQFRPRSAEDGGGLFAVDPSGTEERDVAAADSPKVYSAAGNCLMAHVSAQDCMALSWMQACAVRQMQGYIEPTWFGYAGWGVHKYLWTNPGELTFAEAWFSNQQALLHRLSRLEGAGPGSELDTRTTYLRGGAGEGVGASEFAVDEHELRGLQFDRDNCVLYGDPAYSARLAEKQGSAYYRCELSRQELRITTLRAGCWDAPQADDKEVLPGRPPVVLLPPGFRAKVAAGAAAVVTPLFVLLPLTGAFEAGEEVVLPFLH